MPLVRGCRNRYCPEYADETGWCPAHRREPYWSSPPLPPGWPLIRAAQLAAFPSCAGCGAPRDRGPPRPRPGRRARAGEPGLALPRLPRDDHAPGGRVAVGAVNPLAKRGAKWTPLSERTLR